MGHIEGVFGVADAGAGLRFRPLPVYIVTGAIFPTVEQMEVRKERSVGYIEREEVGRLPHRGGVGRAGARWCATEERTRDDKSKGPPVFRRASLAVEMGGVEPPSRIFGRKYPTRLVDVFRAAAPPRRPGDAAVSRTAFGGRAPTN